MRRIAIIHYAGPPVVGGVESTIYHHARLLGQAGYQVHVIAGCGEPFHPQVTFHHIPEALWKSLYVLEGDIVAWIDTDIKNIHPRFVYGILGPLLRNSCIYPLYPKCPSPSFRWSSAG